MTQVVEIFTIPLMIWRRTIHEILSKLKYNFKLRPYLNISKILKDDKHLQAMAKQAETNYTGSSWEKSRK